MIGKEIIHGFLAPFHAISFLRQHKGCISYIIIPFLINTVVFSTTVWLGISWFDNLVDRFLPAGQAWYWAVLSFVVWIVAGFLVLVLVFFSFTVIGNIIASPFNELLSEKVEETLAGTQNDMPFSIKDFFTSAILTMVTEMNKMTLFVLGMAGLFLLYLVPGIGIVLYPPLALAWTVYFLAIEYSGYVFSRKGASFKEQKAFIRHNRALMAGFGTGVLLLLAIPFAQFFCIPLAVVGATRLWWEKRQGAALHPQA